MLKKWFKTEPFPIACPNCSSLDRVEETWTEDRFLVERFISCKQCGKLYEHWSYGMYFVQGWLEPTSGKPISRIRLWLDKLFKRDLPF